MDKDKGWIKLHRKFYDSDISRMPPHFREVWLYLVANANHTNDEAANIKRGELYRTYEQIAEHGRSQRGGATVFIQKVDSQGISKLEKDDPTYKRPKETAQEKISMDPEELKKKLSGKIEVPRRKLCEVPLGTWISYINKKTGMYRVGGVLRKYGTGDEKSTYMTLANPYNKKSWSAQVTDENGRGVNTFYIVDKELEEKEKRDKDRVYKAYKAGVLVKRKGRSAEKSDKSEKSKTKPSSGSSKTSSSRVKKI